MSLLSALSDELVKNMGFLSTEKKMPSLTMVSHFLKQNHMNISMLPYFGLSNESCC